MYYVGFSTATIVASVIFFQGFNTTDPANSVSLLAGFITTFLGVHLLEISRKPAAPPSLNGHPHSALESGLMNPRLSIQGRMSIDGWNGAGNTPLGGGVGHHNHHQRTGSETYSTRNGHGRQSSLYRAQNATLFNAFEEDELEAAEHAQASSMHGGGESVGLYRLDDLSEAEDEEDEEDEVDERTQLRSGKRRGERQGSGGVSGNGSAMPGANGVNGVNERNTSRSPRGGASPR